MRKPEEIISDLKKIWGENWQTNMEIIANSHDAVLEKIPQSQIDASNKLVWELHKIQRNGRIV